ncbi:MAG: Uma2 family endonuclease [Elainellaceae cyanobacterium]
MISTKLSLADYFEVTAEVSPDESEKRCEFVDGEIIEMPPESSQNAVIAIFLIVQFAKIVPFYWVRNNTEIVVAGRVRIPDLVVLGEELAVALNRKPRNTITPEMPAPLAVVEVVSPGKVNEDRDYRYKRSEYAARGIPEYWIVDPGKAKVSVLTLIDGWYEVEEFEGDEVVKSPQFLEISLTASQTLNPEGVG